MTTGRINQITIVVLQGGDRVLRGGERKILRPSSLVTFLPLPPTTRPTTPREPSVYLSLSAWPAGPSPPWMEGEGSLSSPPGTRSNRTPFVSLVAGDELCRTAGHWLAAGRDCPKRLSPPSPFELLGCMQEALSDHHSRASTSLQVPKKKGGLLRMGR